MLSHNTCLHVHTIITVYKVTSLHDNTTELSVCSIVTHVCSTHLYVPTEHKACCILQQIKTLEAEIEELKRQLEQKKSKTSEYTCCTEVSQSIDAHCRQLHTAGFNQIALLKV